EHLGARRESERREVEEQLARESQALLHIEAAVEMRVIDQTLPADGRARLFEVRAHDDCDAVVELGAQGREPGRVLPSRTDVVDRAGADQGEEAMVAAVENGPHRRAARTDRGPRFWRDRELVLELPRRDERAEARNVEVVDGRSGFGHSGGSVNSWIGASSPCALSSPI